MDLALGERVLWGVSDMVLHTSNTIRINEIIVDLLKILKIEYGGHKYR